MGAVDKRAGKLAQMKKDVLSMQRAIISLEKQGAEYPKGNKHRASVDSMTSTSMSEASGAKVKFKKRPPKKAKKAKKKKK